MAHVGYILSYSDDSCNWSLLQKRQQYKNGSCVHPKNNVLIFPYRYAKTHQSPKLRGQVESQEMQKAEKERKMQKEKSGKKV